VQADSGESSPALRCHYLLQNSGWPVLVLLACVSPGCRALLATNAQPLLLCLYLPATPSLRRLSQSRRVCSII